MYNEGHWILIDATQPYRKWHGFDCPHKEYELLSYNEIRTRLKKEEMYWTHKALDWGNKSLSVLLYAPWLHEDFIVCTEEALEVVFFLLILNSAVEYNLYAYY